MKYRNYRLSERLLNRMVTKYGDNFRCRRCNRPFRVGDVVVSRGGAINPIKWYCKECWEAIHND